MNSDQILGQWQQIKGEAQVLWGKLTDDDWQQAAGDIEKLAGRIRERYGEARETVAKQLNMLIARVRQNAHTPHQESDAKAPAGAGS